jgi:hypothetical protein
MWRISLGYHVSTNFKQILFRCHYLDLFSIPMGTASNKQKKEKKAERNSGTRKSGKKSNAETSEGLCPLPRLLPRPRLKLHSPAPPSSLEPAPERLDTAEETAAADALVSLGKEKPHKKKNSEFEARMDQIFVATVPGVSASDLGEDSDEEQASEHRSSSLILILYAYQAYTKINFSLLYCCHLCGVPPLSLPPTNAC